MLTTVDAEPTAHSAVMARELQRQTVCQMIIAAILLAFAVYWLRPVLIPFVVALFVVSSIAPVLRLLEQRLKFSRAVAIVISFFCGFLLIAGLTVALWMSVQQIATQGGAYAKQVTAIFSDAQEWLQRQANGFAAHGGAQPTEEVPHGEVSINRAQTVEIRTTVERWSKLALATLSSELLALLSSFVVVIIFVFFLLLGELRTDHDSMLGQIDFQMRSYLIVKTIISLVTGIVFGLVLWLFGVPMALTFGLLAFLLNYIPNFGPIAATLLPIPFILLAPEASLMWKIMAISIAGGVQMVSGNVIEPQWMGNSSGLHPVTIMLGLMFWGMLWGVVGMFLATPMMAAVKIVLDRFDSTRPIAAVMSGQSPRLS